MSRKSGPNFIEAWMILLVGTFLILLRMLLMVLRFSIIFIIALADWMNPIHPARRRKGGKHRSQ
jgi:hypothetical protein